jgi:hypothetical protein
MYYRVTEDCPNTEPDETNLGNINTISLERARYKVFFLLNFSRLRNDSFFVLTPFDLTRPPSYNPFFLWLPRSARP